MKRIFWSLGEGLGGFYIGRMGGGPTGGALGFVWGGCIGYGFGSIVSTQQATKRVVLCWGLTSALIGTFFGLIIGAPPDPTLAKKTVVGIFGMAVGALVGSLIDIVHLWSLRRKAQAPHSDSAV